jgi:hypothetical protein
MTDVVRGVVVVFGIDPGRSCGLATLTDGRLSFVFQGSAELMLDSLRQQIVGAQGRYADLTLTVACERYTIFPKKYLHDTEALEVIGAVKLICRDLGVDFVLQAGADAKRLAPNDRLRELGMLVRADEVDTPDANDVRDATRHALLRLALSHTVIYERLVSEARALAW